MQGDNSEQLRKEANQLIDLIDQAITDLDYFSVRNDDVFVTQIINLQEAVKDCRKQL